MNRRAVALLALALAAAGACRTAPKGTAPGPDRLPEAVPRIDQPSPGSKVTSPVVVVGVVPGTWFFEASLPVSVFADDGTLLGRAAGSAEGDWMTTNPVRFRAQVPLSVPPGVESGRLVVEADDPSGAGNPPHVEIRVRIAR